MADPSPAGPELVRQSFELPCRRRTLAAAYKETRVMAMWMSALLAVAAVVDEGAGDSARHDAFDPWVLP
jgi:hypothetical protein